MTNEEVIRNMSRDELGSFLCGLSIKCDNCELKDLCRTKYQKGFYDWLGDECKRNIDDGFWSVENLPDCSLKRDFVPVTSLCEETQKEKLVKQINEWLGKGHYCIGSTSEREKFKNLLEDINNNVSQEEMKRIGDGFNNLEKNYHMNFRYKFKSFVSKLIKRQ